MCNSTYYHPIGNLISTFEVLDMRLNRREISRQDLLKPIMILLVMTGIGFWALCSRMAALEALYLKNWRYMYYVWIWRNDDNPERAWYVQARPTWTLKYSCEERLWNYWSRLLERSGILYIRSIPGNFIQVVRLGGWAEEYHPPGTWALLVQHTCVYETTIMIVLIYGH